MAKIPDPDPSVAAVFEDFPPPIRGKLWALRKLIFETARITEGVGPLTEALKWGQPSYLTEASKSGTTIRIGWKPSTPQQYAMYVHCQTSLVDKYRSLFPSEFSFEGDRAIVFDQAQAVPKGPLASCIAMALTYHLGKKAAKRRR